MPRCDEMIGSYCNSVYLLEELLDYFLWQSHQQNVRVLITGYQGSNFSTFSLVHPTFPLFLTISLFLLQSEIIQRGRSPIHCFTLEVTAMVSATPIWSQELNPGLPHPRSIMWTARMRAQSPPLPLSRVHLSGKLDCKWIRALQYRLKTSQVVSIAASHSCFISRQTRIITTPYGTQRARRCYYGMAQNSYIFSYEANMLHPLII